jgi:hypothetical protein
MLTDSDDDFEKLKPAFFPRFITWWGVLFLPSCAAGAVFRGNGLGVLLMVLGPFVLAPIT